MRLLRTLVIRTWFAVVQYSSQSVPRPEDAPRVCVPGVSSVRVLIFGSGVAVGWGVTSQEIALTGALARAVTARSGRGTDVEVVADMRITVRNALSLLRGLDLAAYDIIVLVLGANDAIRQTPLNKWSSRLAAVLTHFGERASARAQLFVVGIPTIRSIPRFASRFGAIATEHATILNCESGQRSAEYERVTFVPLPEVESGTDERLLGDGRTYRVWAAVIADTIAPTIPCIPSRSGEWGLDDADASAQGAGSDR